MRAAPRLGHAGDEAAFEQVGAGVLGIGLLHRGDEFLAGDEALVCRLGEPFVVISVRPQGLNIAAMVAALDVDQRGIELQRGHRHHHLAIVIRRLHGLEPAQFDQIGAEPDAGRQERQLEGGGLEAPLEHALVEFEHLDRTGLAGLAEPWLERDCVQRDEGEDQFLHLARRAQHPDIRAAIGDDCEVLEVGAQDFAHQRHRLAPRPPTADPDRHAALKAADDLRGAHAFVEHAHSAASAFCASAIAFCQAHSWPQMLMPMCLVTSQLAGSITRLSQPISRSKPPGVWT